MKRRGWVGLGGLCVASVLSACGVSTTSEKSKPASAEPGEVPAGFGHIGAFRGHVKDGKLSLTPRAPDTSDSGDTATLAAPPAASDPLTFRSRMGQNYFEFDTPSEGMGTGSCNPNQYCGSVEIHNVGPALIDNVYAEITTYTLIDPPEATVIWSGAPFDKSAAYANILHNNPAQTVSYGTIGQDATGSAEWKWSFGALIPNDFYFDIDLFGEYRHPEPYAGGTQGAAPNIDACNLAGSVAVMAGADDAEANLQLPFPFTVFDQHFDRIVVGSNGYVLFYATGAATPTLPNSATNTTVTATTPAITNGYTAWFPFWDDLSFATGASGGRVCYATSGASGSRTFYVTWRNARVFTGQPAKTTPSQPFNITVAMEEATDNGSYTYTLPTAGGATNYTRGNFATIADRGVQNGVGAAKLHYFNQNTGLPTATNQYPWRLVRFTTPSDPGIAAWDPPATVPATDSLVASGVTSTSWGPGREDTFWLQPDSTLGHLRRENGVDVSVVNEGAPSGVTLVGTPSVASWGAGRLDVFARGSDNQLWHKWWQDDVLWGHWDTVPNISNVASSPKVVAWGSDRLDIFWPNTSGNLAHTCWDGSDWCSASSGPEDLGRPAGALGVQLPSVVTWGPNRLDMFVIAAKTSTPSCTNLWHKSWNAGWTAWNAPRGTTECYNLASVATPGPSRLDVALISGSNAYHINGSGAAGGWSTRHSLPQLVPSNVQILPGWVKVIHTTPSSRLDIVTRGSNNWIYQVSGDTSGGGAPVFESSWFPAAADVRNNEIAVTSPATGEFDIFFGTQATSALGRAGWH